MNGLQAIQDRILSEARETAAQIEEQADRRIAALLAAANAEKEQLTAGIKQSADLQVRNMMARTQSAAAMESRKMLLQAQQTLIDQVIEKAMSRISQMADPDKIVFYRRLLEQSPISSGEVILSAADRHLADQLLAGFSGKLNLAEEPGAFTSGLILRRDLIEDNLTLESLVTSIRSELVRIAAEILFGQNSAC